AQSGWSGTRSYVKALFVVASMWAAFYGLFPPVFQQDKNVTDNKELFLKYKVLESEVESYPITHLTIRKDSQANPVPLIPKDFINYVDGEMARLGNIAIGFDPTKINYSEAITLSKPSPTPSTNNAGSPPANRR